MSIIADKSDKTSQPEKTDMIVNVMGRLVEVDATDKPEMPKDADYITKRRYYYQLGKYDWKMGNPARSLLSDDIFQYVYICGWMSRDYPNE